MAEIFRLFVYLFIHLFTKRAISLSILFVSLYASNLQVALKRQQAVEDAIAMRLVSNETGKTIDALPPGKIFGMSITEPCNTPTSKSNANDSLLLIPKTKTNRECPRCVCMCVILIARCSFFSSL